MIRFITLFVLINFIFFNTASAQCINIYGRSICAPPGGDIKLLYGQALCGKGQCVEIYGQVYCSRQPGGGAVINYGSPQCVGGCEPASSNYCQIPR